MAVISGKDGTVTIGGSAEAAVQDWFIEPFANLDDFATNDTAGWKNRVAGVKDTTGGFNMLDKPSFNEGDDVAFVGYTNQDIYSQNVMIERIRVNCDMNTGAAVSFAVTFQGNGALTISTGSAP